MKLSRRLYFFYAAVSVTVLFLSFCYAGDGIGDEAGASTQATTLSREQPKTTLVNPATNIPEGLPLGSTLRAEEYIRIIRKQVFPNLQLTPDDMRLQIYKSTPFLMSSQPHLRNNGPKRNSRTGAQRLRSRLHGRSRRKRRENHHLRP